MKKSMCIKCKNFEITQIYYYGRVERMYCKCPAGRRRIQQVRKYLFSVGIDPYDEDYDINREPNT